MSSTKDLSFGDVVRERAGDGRLMTVRRLLDEDGLVECEWYEEHAKKTGAFAAGQLELVTQHQRRIEPD